MRQFDWKNMAERLSISDEDAFEDIFRSHYPVILNFLLYKGCDRSSSEDLAQETFVRLWTERGKLDAAKFSPGWLYTTATNLFLNHVRRQKFVRPLSEEMAGGDDPSEAAERHEMRKLLMACVDQLPPQPRTTFLMSRLDQMKYSEIALHLNLTVKTIETHIGRALKWLRECLQEKQ